MTKTVSSALDTHMGGEVTTLALAWRITRNDGVHKYFTTHDQDLPIDLGVGFLDGVGIYKARNSYKATSMKSSADLDVDRLTIEAIFDMSDIDEDEMRRGLYDYAEIHYFLINWNDLTQGIMKIRRGRLGEVSILSSGIFSAELRGMKQGMRQSIVWAYTKDCTRGVDLGDSMCLVPIYPDVVQRNTAYALGEFVRATNDSEFGFIPITTITNSDFETGDLTGWTTNSGTPIVVTTASGLNPIDGDNFVKGTDALGDWEIEQVIAIDTDLNTTKIDNGDYLIDVQMLAGSAIGNDDFTFQVDFLTAADALISTPVNWGPQKMGGNDEWALAELNSEPVPATARKVRVIIGGVEVANTIAESCFDRLIMQAVDVLDTTHLKAYAKAENPRFNLGGTLDGTTGWNEEAGIWRATRWSDSGSIPPVYNPGMGGWLFHTNTWGSPATISNIFSIDDVFTTADIDAGLITVNVPVQVIGGQTSETYRVEIEALDVNDNLIRVLRDTGTVNIVTVQVWKDLSVEVILPVGTRNIRLSLTCTGTLPTNIDFDLDWIVLEHQGRLFDSSNYDDRIYEVTTEGTTATIKPTYDTVIANTTVDGTVTFTAREAWSRYCVVTAVDSSEPRKIFTVTELTPNSSGVTDGRDFFSDDSVNGGGVTFESGNNKGITREIRDFTADDGVTIEQILELYLDASFDVVIGDKMRVHRGCDFLRSTCRDVFANVINGRFFPDVPGKDFLFKTPDAQDTGRDT